MAIESKESLRDRFKNGDRPDEDDFAYLIDCCYGFTEFEPQLEGNELWYSQPNALTGALDRKSIHLGKFDQSLTYDAVTNRIKISGNNGETIPIGYWGQNSNARNLVTQITTGAKVGIKVEVPEADLHVHGMMRLQFGTTVNAIASSFSDNYYKHFTIPTVDAIKKYYDNRIENLERKLEILTNSLSQRFLEIGLKPNYMLPMDQEYLYFENETFVFDRGFLPNLQELGGYGTLFVAPMDGTYLIDITLHPASGNSGTSFEVLLEVNGQEKDVVARVTNGVITSVPHQDLMVPVERYNSIRFKAKRIVANSVVAFQNNALSVLRITKPAGQV